MELPEYPVPGEEIPAAWGRKVVDYLQAVTLQSGVGYRRSFMPGGTTLSFAEHKPPLTHDNAPVSFRCSLDGLVITVTSGPVRWGTLVAEWTSGATLTVAGVGMWYVVVEYTLGGSAHIMSLQSTEPINDPGFIREWLVRVTCTDDGTGTLFAVIESVNHEGGINIPAYWSPST